MLIDWDIDLTEGEGKKNILKICLKNRESFHVEADEVEFSDMVIIKNQGIEVMSIAPGIFDCVKKVNRRS